MDKQIRMAKCHRHGNLCHVSYYVAGLAQADLASGTFWKHIGDSMHISYEPLAGNEIQDGYSWWKSVEVWSVEYEKRCMVPDISNHKTAEETTALLLYNAPKSMIPVGKQVVFCLMDERLRRAMMYPDPPKWLEIVVDKTLELRGQLIRYFFLPRPWRFRKLLISERESKPNTYHKLEYVAEPWYVKPTLFEIWGPLALWRRLLGISLPGPKFQSDGYKIHEVGPIGLKNSGQKEQINEEERLRSMDRMGCPFK